MTTKTAAAFTSLFFAVTAAPAAVTTVAVDMDPATPGIQSTISVLAGAAFTVDLWATVDAGGVSSFSVSATFDTTELSLNPPAGPAASQPALPGGLFAFVPPTESNVLGQVYSFNGGTLGLGPVSQSFVIGSIAFTAPTPVTNGVNDVNVGYFNSPGLIDDSFDNVGASGLGSTVFTGGRVDVIPEPASVAVLMLSALGMCVTRRRRTA